MMEDKERLKALMTEYIEYIDIKANSKQDYEKILREYAMFVDTLPNLPNRVDVRKYRDHLKSIIQPTSVQKHMVVIRSFYRWYHMEDYGKNVAEGIKSMKIEPGFKHEALSVIDCKRLLERAKSYEEEDILGRRNYALISLLLTTGLRTVEVERADVSDIGFIYDIQVLYIQGKGHDDKDTFVKLSPQVYAIIENYLMERQDEYKPLFINHYSTHKGERIKTRTIRAVVKELLRQIGIDDLKYSAHSLRHTTATLSLLEGASLEETQQLLRHKDPATTQIYIHWIGKMNDQIVWKISDRLYGNTEKDKVKG
jgi:site-specific recombinase XerD